MPGPLRGVETVTDTVSVWELQLVPPLSVAVIVVVPLVVPGEIRILLPVVELTVAIAELAVDQLTVPSRPVAKVPCEEPPMVKLVAAGLTENVLQTSGAATFTDTESLPFKVPAELVQERV